VLDTEEKISEALCIREGSKEGIGRRLLNYGRVLLIPHTHSWWLDRSTHNS